MCEISFYYNVCIIVYGLIADSLYNKNLIFSTDKRMMNDQHINALVVQHYLLYIYTLPISSLNLYG